MKVRVLNIASGIIACSPRIRSSQRNTPNRPNPAKPPTQHQVAGALAVAAAVTDHVRRPNATVAIPAPAQSSDCDRRRSLLSATYAQVRYAATAATGTLIR